MVETRALVSLPEMLTPGPAGAVGRAATLRPWCVDRIDLGANRCPGGWVTVPAGPPVVGVVNEPELPDPCVRWPQRVLVRVPVVPPGGVMTGCPG